MAQQDLYKALGVDKKSSADEIKKAYRKLARQYHPDRNPDDAKAEARFKEVQHAYDVLSDADKRKQYDRGGSFGPFGAGGQGTGPGFDPSAFGDILSNLFGGGGGGAPGGARGGRRPERGRDLETEVRISFDQSLQGVQIPVTLSSPSVCKTCHGTGAKPGTTSRACPRCGATGVESQGQGLFSISRPCSLCSGAGVLIDDPCATCGGSGQVQKTRRLKVNIPAGVRDETRVRIAGKGEAGRSGGPDGDLYVLTRVDPSPVFRRKGDNLEVEVPITIPEAMRGADVEVPTLGGRKTLRVPAGTQHGTLQRLRGEGPPRLGGKGSGDLHYRFMIEVPRSLDAEQSELIDKLSATMNGTDPRAELFSRAGASQS